MACEASVLAGRLTFSPGTRRAVLSLPARAEASNSNNRRPTRAPPRAPDALESSRVWHSAWDGISEDAKNVVRRLLTIEPSARLSAQQAVAEPWVSGRAEETELGRTVSELRNFTVNSRKLRDSRREG